MWIQPRLLLMLMASIVIIMACGGSTTPSETIPIQEATSLMEEGTMQQWSDPPELSLDSSVDYFATLITSKGDVTVRLLVTEVPLTANNFVYLSRQGFYNGVKFHRIIEGFMAQSGDPTGTGRGGPGYRFNDEPVERDYLRGTLAMANSGPNTNGSQFFIMHQDYPLPKNYTIFGLVTNGLDVVDLIATTPVEPSPTGERSMPSELVTIDRIDIREGE